MQGLSAAKQEIEKGVLAKSMLTIVGDCSVDYLGRATSTLAMGKRLVLIKGDGSVSIHQNRLVRPTNYMVGTKISCELCNGGSNLVLRASKQRPKEDLTIIFSGIDDLKAYEMEIVNDLRLSGSERDLNEMLMQDLSMIEPGLKPVNQQQHFQKGVCDIIAEDREGNFVVIELKRRQADYAGVTQLHRYMHEVQKMKGRKTRGILLAPDIRKNAKNLLEQLGLEFAKLDFELTPSGEEKAKIKGLERKQSKITEHMHPQQG
ncbi:Endonuclease NucS [uncultured archaeon]|nr:Endonuclease NucS [uncultured archaeon]